MHRLSGLVMLMGAVSACGGGSGPGGGTGAGGTGGTGTGGTVSCTLVATSGGTESPVVCDEFMGLSAAMLSQVQQQCEAMANAGAQGRFGGGPCSHAQALGGCRLASAAVWYYQGGASSAADVQMLCAQIGATFIAP